MWQIADYRHVGGNREDMKRALMCYGPHSACGGGHCIVIVGWNDYTNSWIIRNSWGAGWGDQGYAEVPYDHAWCSDAYSVGGVRSP